LGNAGSSVERAARESYGKLLAYLASRCGLDAAEDALADAFAAALERWPSDGVPANPEAWLLVVARNHALDGIRRRGRETIALEQVAHLTRIAQATYESELEPQDERIGMLFACAHPAIAAQIRAPLMLQVVLGLDAARIASAFLIAPSTMGQRLVRAKRKIVNAGIPLAVPPSEEFPERLDAVLAAIYVAFGQGWDDPSETDPDTRGLGTAPSSTRPNRCLHAPPGQRISGAFNSRLPCNRRMRFGGLGARRTTLQSCCSTTPCLH
jgi:RNA polymerase sigma-70 factor (ECF subfamily)